MFKNIIYPTKFPDYVGLRIKNGEYEFVFPYMYQEAKDEKDKKEDMLNLLKLIDKYKTLDKVNDKYKKDRYFPFDTYLWMIRDYIENGYYVSNEEKYRKLDKGKIDWKRTIKNNDLVLGTNKIVYKNFIVKQNDLNISNIITEIHKACVYEAISKLGWYYSIEPNSIEKGNFLLGDEKENKKYINILKEEYTSSYTDKKKELLKKMVDILTYLDTNEYNTKSFDLSTNEFEYVFESAIRNVFNNVDIRKYCPKAKWHICGKETFDSSPLRPDTIYLKNDEAYIIDAKYYKYGYTRENGDLPETSSVHKQITYAKNLLVKNKKVKDIHNIFLLPYSSNEPFEYIGYADTEWDKTNKEYENIYTILIDLRTVINCESKTSEELKSKLVDILKDIHNSKE